MHVRTETLFFFKDTGTAVLNTIYNMMIFFYIYVFPSIKEIITTCTKNITLTYSQTPHKDEETGERNKTLSQRGNKNKKMNLKVDLIPSGNSKETDTGGI